MESKLAIKDSLQAHTAREAVNTHIALVVRLAELDMKEVPPSPQVARQEELAHGLNAVAAPDSRLQVHEHRVCRRIGELDFVRALAQLDAAGVCHHGRQICV